MSHRNLEIVQSTRSFHNNVNIILFSISKSILNNARSFHTNNVEIVSMKLMQENIFSLVRMKKLLFFYAIKHIVEGKDLLLCTDSFEVLTYANTFLKNTNVINISDIPDTNGAKLHDNISITNWNINIECLADFIALGRASGIILPSKQVGYQSGYTQLGLSIWQDYFLINQLMGSFKT